MGGNIDGEFVNSFAYGILFDLDNDGTMELVLSYPSKSEDSWFRTYSYSIFDFENQQLITVANNITLNVTPDVSGNYGYTGVALYNGEPVIITYCEKGETSLAENCKYPKQSGCISVLQYNNLTPIKTLEVATTNHEILYKLDNVTVSENQFLNEIALIDHLAFTMHRDIWIQFENTVERMSLSDLIEYLKGISDTPVEDFEDIDPRNEWIKQHMEYAASERFQIEISQTFTGALGEALSDVQKNKKIKAYNTLDSVNKLLGFEAGEINDTQEYELLLAQILFSYSGVESLHDVYTESFYETLEKTTKLILNTPEIADFIGNETVQSISDLVISVGSLPSDSPELISNVNQLLDELAGVKDVAYNQDLLKVFKTSGINFLAGVIVDEAALINGTVQDLLLYISAGEAYCQTSDAFGEMLIQMRRNIFIPSDNPLFTPLSHNNVVSDSTIRGLLGIKTYQYPDPLNTPIVLAELATALENMYISLEECKSGNAWALAQNALSNFNQGSQKVVIKNAVQTSVSLFAALPVVREFVVLQKLFDGMQIAIDTFTKIDDRAYLGTMLMRLQAISYIHYLTVADLSGSTAPDLNWSSEKKSYSEQILGFWNTLPLGEETTLEEFQFSQALKFDEAIKVHKAISTVAISYAQKYYSTYNYSKTVSYADKMGYYGKIMQLKKQLGQFDLIQCHGEMISGNQYFPDPSLTIYAISCPVDLLIYSDTGEQIAILSNNGNEIAQGYEHYFFTAETFVNSGDFIKIAMIPENYDVTLIGSDKGIMDAYIGKISSNSITEIEIFPNIPVIEGDVGTFSVDKDSSAATTLTIGDSVYQKISEKDANSIRVQKLPPLYIWICSGVILLLLIVVRLILASKKIKTSR